MNAISATDTALPAGVCDRLRLFSTWTGAEPFPPAEMVEPAEGGVTFTTAFLSYCDANGLSLDWVWLGSERSLVLGAYNATKGGRA